MRIENNGYIPTGDPVVDRVGRRVYEELKNRVPRKLTDEDIKKMAEEAVKNKKLLDDLYTDPTYG